MVSRTVSARHETDSSAPTRLALARPKPASSVGTGGQNSMIQLDGSGVAPIAPNQGNSGVAGEYGSPSSRAPGGQFPSIGEVSSAPTIAHGVVGTPPCRALWGKPARARLWSSYPW